MVCVSLTTQLPCNTVMANAFVEADANQHLRICRLALASTSIQTAVLINLKEMIAIAHCNTHCISAPWKAAHAVHKYAPVLTEDTDRKEMVEFLEEVIAMGMPTGASIESLKERWGWGV